MRIRTMFFLAAAAIVLLFTACRTDGIITVEVTGLADGAFLGTGQAIVLDSGTVNISILDGDSNSYLSETMTIDSSETVSATSSLIPEGTTVDITVLIDADGDGNPDYEPSDDAQSIMTVAVNRDGILTLHFNLTDFQEYVP